MPALLRASRVGEKAAHLGLDWPDLKGPREKLDEELAELDEAVRSGDAQAIESELGDVLFSRGQPGAQAFRRPRGGAAAHAGALR